MTEDEGDVRLEDMTPFTKSIRCRVINVEDDRFTGVAFVLTMPEGCVTSLKSGEKMGGFRIALSERDGHRFEKLMKLVNLNNVSQMEIALENDGYIRFGLKVPVQ